MQSSNSKFQSYELLVANILIFYTLIAMIALVEIQFHSSQAK